MNSSPRVLTLVKPQKLSERQPLQMNAGDRCSRCSQNETRHTSINDSNKNGLWFASNWDGTKTIEQLLGGGNALSSPGKVALLTGRAMRRAAVCVTSTS